MSTVVFAWVNATARQDGSALQPADIGSSVISQINADGTATAVTTVLGSGTSATVDAPALPGTYNYQVANVDIHGNVGLAVPAVAPVVIAPVIDNSPPAAPTGFTATLTP